MSFQMPGYQEQVLYRADPNLVQTYRSVRNELGNLCRHHVNQYVRIETMDGQTVMGRIVNCQGGLLYLAAPNLGGQRGLFWSPISASDETILTLVLYELLVITLLYT